MDLAELLRTPARHWRVVLPILLTACAFALVVAATVSSYRVEATVGLVGPGVDDGAWTADDARINPYRRNGDRMQVARDAVIDALAARPGTLRDLPVYEVTAAEPDTPVILISATTETPSVARATVLAVAATADRVLQDWQADAGVAPAKRITASVVAGPGPAVQTSAAGMRLAGSVLAAGLLLALFLALMLESLARARDTSPAGRVAPVPGWRDPVALLSVWTGLLFLLPSKLVVAGIGVNITPAALAGGVALAWWVSARAVRRSGLPAGVQPMHLAVALFAAALLLGYLAAATRPIAGDELRGADRMLVLMLTGFGITLLAADGIPSLPRLHTLLDRLVAAGAVLALLGVAQFLTGFDITSWLHIPGLISTTELTFIRERLTFRRVAGTASHPIEFGVALAVLLPLALHRAMSVPRLWRWVTVAVMAVALPMSLSRSAVLTLGVTALVIVPAWSWRRRLVVLASLPVFAAGMHFLAPGLLTALESLFTNIESDSSTHGRTEDYAVVGRFIQASPLLGRGLGTFNPAKYVLLDNQYLGALVEIGAVRLTALLLLFLIGAGTATSARRRAGDDAATAELAQCLAGAILGLAVSFATFDGLAFPTVTGLLFLLCGCAGALWRLTGTGPAGPSARQFRNAPAPAHSSRR